MNSEVTKELWSGFHDGLWRYVRSRVDCDADADDVVQDVFVKVHLRTDELADHERVEAWLFRVTSNAVADHYRDRVRRGRVRNGVDAHAPLHSSAPSEIDIEGLLAACVRPFVGSLPDHYREALELTDLQGLTQAEAAARVGISVSGMKSRVQRGRALLRGSLEHCCEITLDGRNRVIGAEARCDPASCSFGE